MAQIKNLLRGQGRFRGLLLFTVGVNTALRISDLLQLQIGQFLDERGHFKKCFWIKEQKKNKRHVDLALIMHKLNHESIAYTKRYLCIIDVERKQWHNG